MIHEEQVHDRERTSESAARVPRPDPPERG
jgi:hypothetical protein